MVNNKFINAQEVANEIGVSKSYAYKIIQQLNKELKEKDILTISGKVNRKYFMERFGYTEKNEENKLWHLFGKGRGKTHTRDDAR